MQILLLPATFLAVVLPILTAHSQNPVWGKLFDTERGSICIETATSPDGFIFAFGYYSGDLDLGIKTLHPKYDGRGSFIVKMDRDGVVMDAFPLDGEEVIIENGKIDSDGNIIVCGRFFGSIEFNQAEMTNEPPGAFVAKYSPTGAPLWIRIVATDGYSNLAVDESKNVYFVTTRTDGVYSQGSILYKYDPNGNLVYENEFLDHNDQMSYVGAIDVQNGEPIVVGMVYGSGTIFDNWYYSGSGLGFYVAKFKKDGSIKWTTNIGETEYNNAGCNDIVYAADGGFFIAGGLPDNSFLIRYDENGQKLWSKKSFPQRFTGSYLALASDGSLFLATDFYDGADIDGVPLRATPDSHMIANAPNFVLIKMDPLGKVLGLQQAEPGIINDVESIALGLFGEVYIAAWSDSSPIQVGAVSMNSIKDDGWRNADGFVMRFDDANSNYLGFTITTAEACADSPNTFSADLNPADIKTISWNFGDPSSGTSNTSANLSPSHNYKNPGVYKVIATVTGMDNAKRYASLIFNVHPKIIIQLGDDVDLCSGDETMLGVEQNDHWNYKWQDGSAQNVLIASVGGKYWLSVSDGYCTASDSITVTAVMPPPDLGVTDQMLCAGESLEVDLRSFQCDINWSDGNTNPHRTITAPGTYTVTANNACGESKETFKVDLAPVLEIDIASVELCKGQVYTVDLSSIEADLQWNDGDKSRKKTFSVPGTYSLVVSTVCETKTEAFTLNLTEPLKANLGDDRLMCGSSQPVILSAGEVAGTPIWNDGSTTPTLRVERPGTYWIEISNQCETVRDSIEITSVPETLLVPNVITPNGDPHNEYFVLDQQITSTSLIVFNRWGERVYERAEYKNDWNGGRLESAVYYYVLPEYCLKGWIHILK